MQIEQARLQIVGLHAVKCVSYLNFELKKEGNCWYRQFAIFVFKFVIHIIKKVYPHVVDIALTGLVFPDLSYV